jgi:predicted AlkP superfamily pyrophosphatase or phosphodiesterase
MRKTLIVAFDGLDKELIEEFNLELAKMEEFGSIDNETSVSEVKTSELFASFITGENNDKHGIEGLMYRKTPARSKFIDHILPENIVSKVRGLRTAKDVLRAVLRAQDDKAIYTRENLQVGTIFDEIESSRAMFVPSYNPSKFWKMRFGVQSIKKLDPKSAVSLWDTREYSYRKKELLSELENEILPARDLLMCHFHRPDFYQHIYGDSSVGLDKEKLYELYKDLDKFASEILEKGLEKGYERIIFMSDHGLPEKGSHNANAFYASNENLFGEETPHITDFYEKLKERN